MQSLDRVDFVGQRPRLDPLGKRRSRGYQGQSSGAGENIVAQLFLSSFLILLSLSTDNKSLDYSVYLLANVAFHGGYDDVFRILLKQQSLANQSVCRQRYPGHILTVVSVTLLNGKSRVALGEPLSPGCCKRNILTRQGAILSFRKWRTPESPPCVCRQRDLDINSTYSRNVIAVDVRPGH